jgi:hypothetical protein
VPGLDDVLPDEQPETRGRGAPREVGEVTLSKRVKPRADRTAASCSAIAAIFSVSATAASATRRENARVISGSGERSQARGLVGSSGCRLSGIAVSVPSRRIAGGRLLGKPQSPRARARVVSPCLLATRGVAGCNAFLDVVGECVIAWLARCSREDFGRSPVRGAR